MATEIILIPFMEQGALFNAWNTQCDTNAAAANNTARITQIPAFLCPSDASGATMANSVVAPGGITAPIGRLNYFASLGATAAQYGAKPTSTSTTVYEINTARLGPFNIRYDQSAPQYLDPPTNSQQNPNYLMALGAKLSEITDGTTNTALYSEIRRSTIDSTGAAANANDPINNVFRAPSASFTLDTPLLPNCNSPAGGRIAYKGNQYYRPLPMLTNYSHTVTPNYKGTDCTNGSDFTAAHMAARSYHPGGINSVFCDGSVRFFKDSINVTVWRALGSRAGGEIVSSDSF